LACAAKERFNRTLMTRTSADHRENKQKSICVNPPYPRHQRSINPHIDMKFALRAETPAAMRAARITARRVVHLTRKIVKAAAGAPNW
jgi:hypothetical protein